MFLLNKIHMKKCVAYLLSGGCNLWPVGWQEPQNAKFSPMPSPKHSYFDHLMLARSAQYKALHYTILLHILLLLPSQDRILFLILSRCSSLNAIDQVSCTYKTINNKPLIPSHTYQKLTMEVGVVML